MPILFGAILAVSILTVVNGTVATFCITAEERRTAKDDVLAERSASQIDSALTAIFDEDHIAESALDVHLHALRMPTVRRFDYLLRRVLPNNAASPVRMAVGFSQTHPAPPVDRKLPESGQRIESGGQIISPVLDLVAAAVELGRLEELRLRVQSIPAATPLSSKNRSALLALILQKAGDHEAALMELESFMSFCREELPDDQEHRAAELIAFEGFRQIPDSSELLLPAIDQVVSRQKRTNVRTPWFRQFRTRMRRLENIPNGGSESLRSATGQWASFSTVSAESRGLGLPPSQWRHRKGRVDNVVSHGDDHLYFASPLRGRFQVECDVSGFNWSETRLLVCGVWVSPVYDHKHFDIGNLRNSNQRFPIVPPLSRISDTFHYRTFVENNIATTTANGRNVHVQPLADGHDPWVAVRNGSMQEGSAFNVRVTGTPEIPETIHMTDSPTLESWLPYFGGGVSGRSDHWQRPEAGGILGLRSLNATYSEQALFYHRPMLEDGTIEYEFFYKFGQANAHLALDRLCLMMRPDGVRVHWLTDGRYDRTELSPDNENIEPENRRGPAVMPLQDNAWNTVRLSLRGDVIDVSLNDQLVCRRILESTNQRLFGFFHFADQEELQVRNVRWSGNWPRTLPPVSEQELALDDEGFLEQTSQHMTSHLQYDFAKDGLADERITLIHGSRDLNFHPEKSGVRSMISGPGGYRNATLAPSVQIQGDFDVIAEYEQFRSDPSVKGSSSLMLVALLQNAASDEFVVTRRHMFPRENDQQHILQCVIARQTQDGSKRDFFTTKTLEDQSGRMRLSRRENKIYYLTAEGNSPNFRLWGTRVCATDPVQMDGIRLLTQIHEPGETSVVWKSISVRAEKLMGSAMGDADPRIVELNEQRDDLAKHVEYDFRKTPPGVTALYRWADVRPWNANDGGLKILAPGDTRWTSAGITTRQPIIGDFDIRANVEAMRLDKPTTGEGTGIFLQVDLADGKETQISAIFSMNDAGLFEFDSQHRTLKDSGGYEYQNRGRINTASVSSLRIARRGTLITVLAQRQATDAGRVIGQFEVNTSPVSGAKLLLHTGGPDRESEILLKSLDVYAAIHEPLLTVPTGSQ